MKFDEYVESVMDGLGRKLGLGPLGLSDQGESAMTVNADGLAIPISFYLVKDANLLYVVTKLGSISKEEAARYTSAGLLALNMTGLHTLGMSFASMMENPAGFYLGHCVFGSQLTIEGLDDVVGRLVEAAKEWRQRFKEVS